MEESHRRLVITDPERMIHEITASGLRDRDLENLPVGRRFIAHRGVSGEGKRVVSDCVDADSESGILSFVLASKTGQVVTGAFAAAAATDSRRVEFRVAEDDETGAKALARALEEDPPPAGIEVEISRAPFRQNLKGYEDVPTLVINAETLAAIALVLEVGAEEFRRSGTATCPGSKLCRVSGSVENPGLYELPLGTPLRGLIEERCGGVTEGKTLLAVIVGGDKGACYTEEELDIPLDFDRIHDSGGTIGSGAIAVLDTEACIVDQTRGRLVRSCYDECGKCSLGREGSYQLREMMVDMTRGKSRSGDLDMLREVGRTMQMGCACASGRMAPNIVLSTLAKFPEEYEAHMKRRLCKALVCEKYVSYHILPDLCDGCGACADECPEEAIEGGHKKIHVIDQDSCEKCGKCYAVCAELRMAVAKAGAVKPRTPKRPIPVGSWKG